MWKACCLPKHKPQRFTGSVSHSAGGGRCQCWMSPLKSRFKCVTELLLWEVVFIPTDRGCRSTRETFVGVLCPPTSLRTISKDASSPKTTLVDSVPISTPTISIMVILLCFCVLFPMASSYGRGHGRNEKIEACLGESEVVLTVT